MSKVCKYQRDAASPDWETVSLEPEEAIPGVSAESRFRTLGPTRTSTFVNLRLGKFCSLSHFRCLGLWHSLRKERSKQRASRLSSWLSRPGLEK